MVIQKSDWLTQNGISLKIGKIAYELLYRGIAVIILLWMKLSTIYIHYCFVVPTLIDVLSPMLQLSLSATSPALWLEYPGGILVFAYSAFLDPNLMKYHHNARLMKRELQL